MYKKRDWEKTREMESFAPYRNFSEAVINAYGSLQKLKKNSWSSCLWERPLNLQDSSTGLGSRTTVDSITEESKMI